jgi:hypothetical protein
MGAAYAEIHAVAACVLTSGRKISRQRRSRMSVRRTAWLASGLVLALAMVTSALAAGPYGKKPPPPPTDRTPPTTPTNLRITASSATSVSLAWNPSTDASSFWYIVQQNGSSGFRVDPPKTTFTRTKLAP